MSTATTSSLPESPGTRHHAYNRKQKSLGLLCSNFVMLYDREGIDTVGLDDAAKQLGVERRRIYDIVNVLESVGIIAKAAKNRYSWIGFSGIPKALQDLKEDALKEMQGSLVKDASLKFWEDEEDERSLGSQTGENGDEKQSSIATCSAHFKARSGLDSRREKSLGLLTQNFVKLFLTTDVDTISLDEAARLLLGDGHESAQMKNNNAAKVRRLYDIANVLSSVNLIEKTQQMDTRKPAFRWLGLTGNTDSGVKIARPPSSMQGSKREFGTNITNVDGKRKVASAVEKNPNKLQTRNHGWKEQKQPQSSRGYVYGPFGPGGVAKGSANTDRRGKGVQDWEGLASLYSPQYCNHALSELFSHYKDAYTSWFEAGSCKLQPKSSLSSKIS